jgi:coenzyme F420-0:L-glutamate ligase / coenzyme F420-1:gamma-L-glutamate ligase
VTDPSRPPVEVVAIEGMPEVRPGDDLIAALAPALGAAGVRDGDVVVVTSKVVSKAEGRLVPDNDRGATIATETVRVVARRHDLVIAETAHGFVCANAGVDLSNVDDGQAALLPVEPDRSARRIRDGIRAVAGVEVAVIVSDTFGRAWRIGLTDVAIGVSGLAAVVDLRGEHDATGRELQVTEVALADEIAGAAELVKGKAAQLPAAVVRGLDPAWFREGSARELVRPPGEDLFR